MTDVGLDKDKGAYLERWLVGLRRTLEARGLLCRTSYEDQPGGDALALAVWSNEGLVELQLHRDRRGAVLRLLAETVDATRIFSGALEGEHRTIPRLKNAQRRFIHRIERMAAHLVITYDARAAAFPQAALAALQTIVPKSGALVGLQATFRGKQARAEELDFDDDAEVDAKTVRQTRRYPTVYAATIDTAAGPRAARYQPEQGAFYFAGAALSALGALPLPQTPEGLGAAAVANELHGSQPSREAAQDAGEVLELGYHVLDAASTCADIGCDLPDCGVCDVPDCG